MWTHTKIYTFRWRWLIAHREREKTPVGNEKDHIIENLLLFVYSHFDFLWYQNWGMCFVLPGEENDALKDIRKRGWNSMVQSNVLLLLFECNDHSCLSKRESYLSFINENEINGIPASAIENVSLSMMILMSLWIKCFSHPKHTHKTIYKYVIRINAFQHI